MRTLLFALLLCNVPLTLLAQLDDIIQDNNVSYVATFVTEHDFRLANSGEKTKMQLLKLPTPKDGCLDFVTDNWLGHWLMDGMKKGHFKAYDDAEMTVFVGQPILMQRLQNVDIITTFDPETYQEQVQTVSNERSPNEIRSFKTYQAIFFDKKTNSFQTRLLSVAPMVNMVDNSGKVTGKEPIAWLAMDGKLPDGFSIENKDVAWSALLLDMNNPLKVNELKVLKGDFGKKLGEQVYQTALTMKHPIDYKMSYGCEDGLTKQDLESMLMMTDTVIVFDPDTYTETITVYKNEYKPAETKKLLLAQVWFYDQRRRVLSNRLEAIAPIEDKVDENGNFMYDRPLYFLRFLSKI